MKRLLLILLLFVPAGLRAAPVDSVLRLPFTLRFEIAGTFHNENEYMDRTDSSNGFNTVSIEITADSNNTRVDNNVMEIRSGDDTCTIVFDPSNHTIDTITVSHSNLSFSSGEHGTNEHYSTSALITLTNLLYDSTIFALDNNFGSHVGSVAYSDVWGPQGTMLGDFGSSELIQLSSLSLSGDFRPVTFQNPTASVATPIIAKNFRILQSGNTLTFTLDPTADKQVLNVYSVIGSHIADMDLLPGQTSASIALSTGFYLIRLGDQVTKVWVPE